MGEAKRRKKLDRNYGKKLYSIEFMDYETYKQNFVDRFKDDPNFEIPDQELEFFNKLFWLGYINIEDSKYSFLLLFKRKETDQEGLALGTHLQIETPENSQHNRIIDLNINKIEDELLEIVKPRFDQFIVEEMEKEMLDDEDDEDEDGWFGDDYYDESDFDENKIEIDGDEFFDDPDINIDNETLLSSDKWVYRPLSDYDWTRGKLEHLAQGIATKETVLPKMDNLTKDQILIISLSLAEAKTRSEVEQRLEKLKENMTKKQDSFTDSVYEKVEEYLDNRQKRYEEIMEKCLSKGIYRYHFIADGDGDIIDYKCIEYRPNHNLEHCNTLEPEDITLY